MYTAWSAILQPLQSLLLPRTTQKKRQDGLHRKSVHSAPLGVSGVRVESNLRVRLIEAELAKQASEITMYDVKSYYEQAKNRVLNVPEMEAKVREATNDDPW